MASLVSRRTVALMILIGLLFGAAIPVQASDGEILESSNSDRFSNVTDGGSKAKVTIDSNTILEDCPVGSSGCRAETRWRSKRANCSTCWWSTDSFDNAIRLAPGTTTIQHCQADGSYYFDVQVRLHWWNPASRTTSVKGTTERRFEVGSSTYVYKYIPVALYISGYGGFTGGTTLETKTVTEGTSNWYTIATSGSSAISTDC